MFRNRAERPSTVNRTTDGMQCRILESFLNQYYTGQKIVQIVRRLLDRFTIADTEFSNTKNRPGFWPGRWEQDMR